MGRRQDRHLLERAVIGRETSAKQTGHDDALDRVARRAVPPVGGERAGLKPEAGAHFHARHEQPVRQADHARHAARRGQRVELCRIERVGDGRRVTVENPAAAP